jgi:hypothetical protein
MKLEARIKELEQGVQSPGDTSDPCPPQCQDKSHHSRHKGPLQVRSSPAQESSVSPRSPAHLGRRQSLALIDPTSPTGPLHNKTQSDRDSKTVKR